MIKSLSIPLGRFFGTEVRLHLAFFMLALYAVLPATENGVVNIPRALFITLMVFVAVVMHEVAHLWVARMRQVSVRLVILLPTGGVTLREAAEGSRELSRSDEVIIALAGPLFSLLTGGVLIMTANYLHPNFDLISLPQITTASLWKSVPWAFLYLGTLNLIPAYPLDGGRILRSLLASEKGVSYEQATRKAVMIGQVFSISLIFAGIWSSWLLLIGFFLFVGVQLEDRTLLFHAVVDTVHLEDIMLTDFATLSPVDTLEDALHKSLHTLQDDFPVIREGSLVGVINRGKIIEAIREEGNGYVQSVMNKVFEVAQKRASLAWALRQFTSGASIIPIVDEQMLVGIVTRQNLMRSMGLLAESRKLKQELQEQDDDDEY